MEEENELMSVSTQDIPAVVGEQLVGISNAREKLELARFKSKHANEVALAAKNKKAGLLFNKEAIQTLQDSTIALSEATIQNAEAQEEAFEYQQTIANATKYLFYLGTANLAATRSVIKELSEQLEKANEEELDEQARKEILRVIKDLKSQEDVFEKQQKLNEITREHDKEIKSLKAAHSQSVSSLENKIMSLEARNSKLRKQMMFVWPSLAVLLACFIGLLVLALH